MKEQAPRDIAKILLETDLADRAVRRAVREAVLRHKLLGESIVVSRNGEVVRLSPDEIEIPPEEPEPEPAR
jgi:hypothetical protein